MEHRFSLSLNQKHLEQVPRDCQTLFEIVYIMYPYPTEGSYFFIGYTQFRVIQLLYSSLL